jgi:hypothetical protein
MKTERSVVGKLKNGADLFQVDATHCLGPEEAQSLGSADRSKTDPLKCKYKDNEVFCFHFDVCGSYILVIYMFNSGPTRCTLYSLFLSSLTLHVLGAICNHHYKHNCSLAKPSHTSL